MNSGYFDPRKIRFYIEPPIVRSSDVIGYYLLADIKNSQEIYSLRAFSNLLDYLDSNQDKQNQNLLCYHYTIVQTYVLSIKEV